MKNQWNIVDFMTVVWRVYCNMNQSACVNWGKYVYVYIFTFFKKKYSKCFWLKILWFSQNTKIPTDIIEQIQ